MAANPNINSALYIKEIRADLDAIRNHNAEEAFKARGDHATHQAMLHHGRSMMMLTRIVNGLWTDTFARLLRENKQEPSQEALEAAYRDALAATFESHLEKTWLMFGDRAGEREIRATQSSVKANAEAMAAARHHAAIAGFCDHYVTKLRERAQELSEQEVPVAPGI
jgi:hypothetical protein